MMDKWYNDSWNFLITSKERYAVPELTNEFFSVHSKTVTMLVSGYFEPSQPQRITPGLRQTSICLLFIDYAHKTPIHKFSAKNNNKSVPTQIYIKQNTHRHQTQNFRRISLFGIAPVKKHTRLGHTGIVDLSVDLSIPNFKRKYF